MKEPWNYSCRICVAQRIFIELDLGSEDNELDFIFYHGASFIRKNEVFFEKFAHINKLLGVLFFCTAHLYWRKKQRSGFWNMVTWAWSPPGLPAFLKQTAVETPTKLGSTEILGCVRDSEERLSVGAFSPQQGLQDSLGDQCLKDTWTSGMAVRRILQTSPLMKLVSHKNDCWKSLETVLRI